MPKTKEEILADIAKAVDGQGNQGAIAIAPILKDIVELAGEGGGGGVSTPNVISVTQDGDDLSISNPDDLEDFAEKAEDGESVMLKITSNGQTIVYPAAYGAVTYGGMTVRTFTVHDVTITTNVVQVTYLVNVGNKTISQSTTTYPS